MGPVGELAREGSLERGVGGSGWGADETVRIAPDGPGKFQVGAAGIEEDLFPLLAAPVAERTIRGEDELAVPAAGEAVGVLLVAEFATEGGTDVVTHHAGEGADIGATEGAGAKAEVDVFATVDIALVEAPELLPEVAGEEEAGAGESGHGPHGKEQAGET